MYYGCTFEKRCHDIYVIRVIAYTYDTDSSKLSSYLYPKTVIVYTEQLWFYIHNPSQPMLLYYIDF